MRTAVARNNETVRNNARPEEEREDIIVLLQRKEVVHLLTWKGSRWPMADVKNSKTSVRQISTWPCFLLLALLLAAALLPPPFIIIIIAIIVIMTICPYLFEAEGVWLLGYDRHRRWFK